MPRLDCLRSMLPPSSQYRYLAFVVKPIPNASIIMYHHPSCQIIFSANAGSRVSPAFHRIFMLGHNIAKTTAHTKQRFCEAIGPRTKRHLDCRQIRLWTLLTLLAEAVLCLLRMRQRKLSAHNRIICIALQP